VHPLQQPLAPPAPKRPCALASARQPDPNRLIPRPFREGAPYNDFIGRLADWKWPER
jgi:hypothetical protein